MTDTATREAVLAAVWQHLLEVEVTPEDNFFDLGGYSLLVVSMVSEAKKQGLDVSADDVFQHRTLRDLAAVAVDTASGR